MTEISSTILIFRNEIHRILSNRSDSQRLIINLEDLLKYCFSTPQGIRSDLYLQHMYVWQPSSIKCIFNE